MALLGTTGLPRAQQWCSTALLQSHETALPHFSKGYLSSLVAVSSWAAVKICRRRCCRRRATVPAGCCVVCVHPQNRRVFASPSYAHLRVVEQGCCNRQQLGEVLPCSNALSALLHCQRPVEQGMIRKRQSCSIAFHACMLTLQMTECNYSLVSVGAASLRLSKVVTSCCPHHIPTSAAGKCGDASSNLKPALCPFLVAISGSVSLAHCA